MGDARWSAFEQKQEAIEAQRQRLQDIWFGPAPRWATGSKERPGNITEPRDPCRICLPGRRQLSGFEPVARAWSPARKIKVLPASIFQAKYAGYIKRQQIDIDKMRQKESVKLPPDLDYLQVRGLSTEAREKLSRNRPLPWARRGAFQDDAGSHFAVADPSEKQSA